MLVIIVSISLGSVSTYKELKDHASQTMDTGKMDEGEEASGELIIAGSNPSTLPLPHNANPMTY